MNQQTRSTFVISDPTDIIQALVGLKDIRVLYYRRRGRIVELAIEQVVVDRQCPCCGGSAWVKDCPIVRYIDLPVYDQPMRLALQSSTKSTAGSMPTSKTH